MPTRWKLRAVVLSAAIALAFAPVTFSSARGLTVSEAACTTCCKEMTSKCVKCTENCLTIENAYDKGSGPCPVQDLN